MVLIILLLQRILVLPRRSSTHSSAPIIDASTACPARQGPSSFLGHAGRARIRRGAAWPSWEARVGGWGDVRHGNTVPRWQGRALPPPRRRVSLRTSLDDPPSAVRAGLSCLPFCLPTRKSARDQIRRANPRTNGRTNERAASLSLLHAFCIMFVRGVEKALPPIIGGWHGMGTATAAAATPSCCCCCFLLSCPRPLHYDVLLYYRCHDYSWTVIPQSLRSVLDILCFPSPSLEDPSFSLSPFFPSPKGCSKLQSTPSLS